MAIVYEGEGDLFKSECQVITVPVNTVGVMGKGLALAFKLKYPDLFKVYRELCRSKELRVGVPYLYRQGSDRDVLLFPTKMHWKDPSRLEWIEEGLDYVYDTYEELGIESLALPPLGCGNGGLDYLLDVRPVIYQCLDDSDLPVEVLLYKP